MKRLDETILLVRSTGKALLERLSCVELNIRRKDNHHGNLVTDFDVWVQNELEHGLKKIEPTANFFAEEQENTEVEGLTWFVDPIDGTTNFVSTQKNFAISVALYDGKAPIFGIVYDVVNDVCYHAMKDAGAFKNGEKINWVCCGRNSQGKNTCNNKIVIDEGELLTSIKEYLSGLISDKQRVIKKIVSDFNKSYEPMNKNRKTEKELEKEIEKLKKSRQKYIDMYVGEVISMDDLKEKTASINAEIKHLEEKLKMARYGITQGDKLQIGLVDTFKTIGDILNSAEITNEMLKQVIDRIEVSPAGQVDIYLKLLTDIGLDKKYHFNDDRT